MKHGQSNAIRSAIRSLMTERGIGAKTLSREASLGETAIRDILEGRVASPRINTLSAIAKFFNVPLAYLLEGSDVAVVGKIGAGGSVAFEQAENFGHVPRPPDTDGELIGLEIEGDSMLPKFDPGDVVYISPGPQGVNMALLGSYCACRLVTGETYLKILSRGTAPGLYTLRSLNAADMEDRALEWATPVRAILPRFARHYR